MEKGTDGVVTAGGSVVAQILRYNFDEIANTEAIGLLGVSGAVSYKTTTVESTGTIECKVLDADAGQVALAAGAEVSIEMRRQGTGSGLPQAAVTATITRISESVEASAYNPVTFQWQGGAINRADQA